MSTTRAPQARRVLGGAAISAAALLLAAACGSSGTDSASTRDSGDATPTASSTPSAATSAPGGAPSASSGRGDTPQCTTADLRFSLGRGDGAAGSTYVPVVMRNASDHACRSGGYGGISYVTSPKGAPVGAPATRDKSKAGGPFVLLPGGHATAQLRQVEPGNYDAGQCRPTKVTGLRIYPPNMKSSTFLARPGQACANPKVQLLSLSPYQPVK